ncbi:MAG: hypothetical protein H6569_10155 [Lewinellaceae bacterium]|nr:hypothetical protein [Lewinellaceae bacterium]
MGAAITAAKRFVYAETAQRPTARTERFNVTINTTLTADAPADVTVCDSYTLPVLTVGTGLTAQAQP